MFLLCSFSILQNSLLLTSRSAAGCLTIFGCAQLHWYLQLSAERKNHTRTGNLNSH